MKPVLTKDQRTEVAIGLHLFRVYVEDFHPRPLYRRGGVKNEDHPHWRNVKTATKLGCLEEYKRTLERFPEMRVNFQ